MKKFFVSVLIGIFAILLIAAIGVGGFLYYKYYPAKDRIAPAEWFGVSDDQVAIVLNDQREGTAGIYRDGQAYLPLVWVQENLNERFYWDSRGKQLIYTLPTSIVYATIETLGKDGIPLLINEDDQVWLRTGLILSYSDIRVEVFAGGDVKRVLIDTRWEPVQVATVIKDDHIRELGGVKSPILTDVKSGTEVTILEELENWSKVQTADGYMGYIQNKRLTDISEKTYYSSFEAPEYTSIALDEQVCLAWHQVTVEQANQTLEQLLATAKGVNVVAPTWFMLTDNAGNYDSLADRSYVDKAHAMGLQVWGVLDNFNRGDNVKSEVLFANTTARETLITNLMKDVATYDLDGINLDIEMIKSSAGSHYVQFIRELSVECRKNQIILSVDNAVPISYASFYNHAEQGRVADYVILMGYDEHTGKDIGSVASLGFEREGIEAVLKMVPAEKIISGIPFYMRLWKQTGDEVTFTVKGIAGAQKWIEENNVEMYWQEELGQYYGELTIGDDKYYLWQEDARSIGKKMELVQEYQLAGVAFWRLGFETEAIWDVINP